MDVADSWQQEQVSLAYVAALATRGGYTLGRWEVDKDGVDLSVRRSDGLTFELQMKCTYSPKMAAQGAAYSYDLDIPTYDKLRAPTRTSVGFLGLVIVPRDIEQWMIHDEHELTMRCSGYWAKLQDAPSVENKATKAIHLPLHQRIDLPGFEEMFSHAMHRLMFGAQAVTVA
ncbi:DUF4365 domain-containing protein [Streptomyces sp. DSM 44915]|uniref:DUF4365 domain-containing protein n=1 Tax=Streptomyces chisholmiae TaxID=3075540 RepID=A0ABU2JYV2_9ACTN|nr:DUF4365 domain-containing protein [Streptomyces sp. DSM 44915]MDT0270022.1 DUF4365 domain-containing protein [Streptomyces sp. DSM 44915]